MDAGSDVGNHKGGKTGAESVVRVTMAGFLTWLLPGLGHLYLGHRQRGLVLLIVIALTFWGGVAIGGIRGTVHPGQRPAWFVAQLCAGGHTLLAYGIHRALPGGVSTLNPVTRDWPHAGHWGAVEIGVVYAAVAGLLNVLIILDALVRADQGPLPQAAASPAPLG